MPTFNEIQSAVGAGCAGDYGHFTDNYMAEFMHELELEGLDPESELDTACDLFWYAYDLIYWSVMMGNDPDLPFDEDESIRLYRAMGGKLP